jgi:hypothetical protein
MRGRHTICSKLHAMPPSVEAARKSRHSEQRFLPENGGVLRETTAEVALSLSQFQISKALQETAPISAKFFRSHRVASLARWASQSGSRLSPGKALNLSLATQIGAFAFCSEARS